MTDSLSHKDKLEHHLHDAHSLHDGHQVARAYHVHEWRLQLELHIALKKSLPTPTTDGKSHAHHADKTALHPILHPTLHAMEVTDIERDKHIVTDRKRNDADRLHAAHELAASLVSEINFAEGGVPKKFLIAKSQVDGRLRVIEENKQHGNKIVLEDPNGHSFTDHISADRLEVTHRDHRGRVHRSHVEGMHYGARHLNGVGSYRQPNDARQIYSPAVDPKNYQMLQNPDGSKTIEFNGCNVDTDGASYHKEDQCWQPHTSLRLANGESLNTDLDNFVVLSPSLAKACGVQLGDLGYLVDKTTGRAVPVVFGDSGPEGKKSAEASVHAIKQLGRDQTIDGNHGLSGRFQVVVVPHSGNHTGEIARNPDQMRAVLQAHTQGQAALA